MILKLSRNHYVLKLYKVYINAYPSVDLDLFFDNVKFGETCFCTYSKHRYQVSVYRTIGPLLRHFDPRNQIAVYLRPCDDNGPCSGKSNAEKVINTCSKNRQRTYMKFEIRPNWDIHFRVTGH